MRRVGAITNRVRAASTVAVSLASFMLVASGCQLITGSYTVESLGPVCTGLAACCGLLSSAEETACSSAVAAQNEGECGAVQSALPSNACTTVVKGHDGGGTVIILLPDAHSSHDGFISLPPLDASTPHDAKGSHDVSAPDDVTTTNQDSGQGGGDDSGDDAGDDASDDTGGGGNPPDLTGTWTLGGATCNGQQLGLDVGSTTTLTFETGSAEEIESLSDGCVITEDLEPDSITDTDITSTGGSVACGSSCTTTDDCSAGAIGDVELPYTLSDGTLTLSETVDTSECSSGTIQFNFQMD